MSFVRSFLKCQSILYDFSKLGGAIGSYPAGIKLPNRAFIVTITAREFTALSDGGLGANFQIGWTGSLGAVTTINPPIVLATQRVQDVGIVSTGLSILFTISAAPIIAGKVVFDLIYTEGKV